MAACYPGWEVRVVGNSERGDHGAMTHNQYDGIGRDRKLIVILGGLSAFGPLSMDMYLPGLPAMTRDLGASASTGQLTLTGCMLGIAGGQLFIGPISDRLGRRRPLLIGLVGYIAASLACAAAPSIWSLIALRFIQGTLGGAGVVIARAVVRDLFSGSAAARVFALLMAVMGVAPIFAPLVGGQALAVTSWRGIFVVLAGIGDPLLVATLMWLPETLPAARRHAGGWRGSGGKAAGVRAGVGWAGASRAPGWRRWVARGSGWCPPAAWAKPTAPGSRRAGRRGHWGARRDCSGGASSAPVR